MSFLGGYNTGAIEHHPDANLNLYWNISIFWGKTLSQEQSGAGMAVVRDHAG